MSIGKLDIKRRFEGRWGELYQHLLGRPERDEANGRRWVYFCPFHQDKLRPNLKVELATGLYHCFACRAGGDALKFWMEYQRVDFKTMLQQISEVFNLDSTSTLNNKKPAKKNENEKTSWKEIEAYDYQNAAGELLYQILRYEREADGKCLKSFKVRRPARDGSWIWNLQGVKLALYRLPEISNPARKEEPVIIVEGERKADRLSELGYLATTNPFGALKWRDNFSDQLLGREVIILPDKDKAGQKHKEQVARSLSGKAKIYIAELPAEEGVNDVVDFLKRHTPEELAGILEKAVPYTPTPEPPPAPAAEAQAASKVAPEGSSEVPVTWEQLEAAFKDYLELPNLDPVRVVLATVIANRLKGDPVWLFLVAPPASAKTEIILSLSGLKDAYTLSTLTQNTFLSGKDEERKHKEQSEISLLPRLTGKILVMKDFAPILQMYHFARDAIFAQLRDIYDGSTAKAVGSEKREIRWEGKIGFIAGITQVLDTYSSFISLLGERFLQYRLEVPQESDVMEKALRSTGREKEIRAQLQKIVASFLDSIEIPSDLSNFVLPNHIKEKLFALIRFVIRARTGVMRDSYGHREIYYIPDHEGPARLTKQLLMLMYGLAILRNSKEINEEDYKLVYKVAMDSIHKIRRRILDLLATKEIALRTTEISIALDLSRNTATRYLEDLTAVGILQRLKEKDKEEEEEDKDTKDTRPNFWIMKDELREWWKMAIPGEVNFSQ